MDNFIIGLALILIGILYQVKPDLFKRWFWKKTSIAQRLLGPDGYLKYMRGLGLLYILGGVILCVISLNHAQVHG